MSKQQHHYSVTGPDGRTHLCKTPQQCNQKYLELYPQGESTRIKNAIAALTSLPPVDHEAIAEVRKMLCARPAKLIPFPASK